MAPNLCDFRILLLAAAAAFIIIQMRPFSTQSEYADRLAAAVESENQCTSQSRFLIDQIKARRSQDEECGHLRALVHDLERKGVKRLIEKEVPVAAVVVMACNRPDYQERTLNSILKYQTSISSKFPLFVSQDGPDQNVKNMALSYNKITYMQGSNFGQYFSQYLESIKLNDVHVDWKSKNLSYLEEDKFWKYFSDLVTKAKPVYGADAVIKAYDIDGDVRIQYNDQMDFERIARQFGIFEEWKDGIPGTTYKGVVVFRYQTPRCIFLVGPDSLPNTKTSVLDFTPYSVYLGSIDEKPHSMSGSSSMRLLIHGESYSVYQGTKNASVVRSTESNH